MTFNKSLSLTGIPMQLPCRQCIGCRIDYSRDWAIRCKHEADMHECNDYITLTYSPEHLPKDLSLHSEDFQKFMKRLRKKYPLHPIRYFHCGEYGEPSNANNQIARPHYHAILFGFSFTDRMEHKEANGNMLYTSKILSKIWGKGHCIIGNVTYQSAAYVARYIMKKINGDRKKEHYQNINLDTGEVNDKKPEYTTMSLKPGIGSTWYDKYKSDIYPSGFVLMNNRKYKIPRYYDNLYKTEYPEKFEELKKRRIATLVNKKRDSTKERLAVRETVQNSKIKRLIRHKEI